MVILCVGSLIVIYIGISLLRAKTQDLEKDQPTMSIKKTISSACVVTWFNPQAIIDGTMMLGAFHVTLAAGQETPFITGVACASFSWFIRSYIFDFTDYAVNLMQKLCDGSISCVA